MPRTPLVPPGSRVRLLQATEGEIDDTTIEIFEVERDAVTKADALLAFNIWKGAKTPRRKPGMSTISAVEDVGDGTFRATIIIVHADKTRAQQALENFLGN